MHDISKTFSLIHFTKLIKGDKSPIFPFLKWQNCYLLFSTTCTTLKNRISSEFGYSCTVCV